MAAAVRGRAPQTTGTLKFHFSGWKACFKCGRLLPLSAFYAHPKMADGHLGKCADCTKRDVSKNRRRKQKHYSEYEMHRARLPHRRALTRRVCAEWAARLPFARPAHSRVARAVLSGRIEKQPCEVCGTRVAVHAHHDDYTKPLDVRWLCARHHKEAHVCMQDRAGEERQGVA